MGEHMAYLRYTQDLTAPRDERYAAWITTGDDAVVIALEATYPDVRESARDFISALALQVDTADVAEADA